MTFIQKQTLWVSRDADGNINLHFPTTHVAYVEGGVATVNGATPDENKNITIDVGVKKVNDVAPDTNGNVNIPVGVKTVNGIEPTEDGDVVVAGVPIGFEYISFNPNIPAGSLPLLGGTFNREAYADLWAWVQTQTGYLISETAWQSKAVSNSGNVPFYSDGDGSTTFRVPSLCCWVKGANGISEVGSYLAAGLPNIEGTLIGGKTDAAATDEQEQSGAFAFDSTVKAFSGGNGPMPLYTFDASRSNDIYGNSDTVQPESIVGMWLVKAFGTVSNVGNQDIADVSASLTATEARVRNVEERTNGIIDYIVESWREGTEWYRVYKSGWVEQGGEIAASNHGTVSLLNPMASKNYFATVETTTDNSNFTNACAIKTRNTTGFEWTAYQGSNTRMWYACGQGV